MGRLQVQAQGATPRPLRARREAAGQRPRGSLRPATADGGCVEERFDDDAEPTPCMMSEARPAR